MDSSKKSKKRIFRNILGIGATILICAAGLTGIGLGSYNVAKNINVSNDFTEGRSIQLNLRLYQTNNDGTVKFDAKGNPVPIYADKATQDKNVEKSAKALNNILESKGLTNIKVSYGESFVQNNLFPNQQEPVAVLYATFENSITAFNLKDIKDEVNKIYNDKNVFNALNDSLNYEIESIEPVYNSKTYPIPTTKTNTGRSANSAIMTNEQHAPDKNSDTFNTFNDINDLDGDKVHVFTDKKGTTSKTEVAFILKSDLPGDYNQFNSWAFGEQKKIYEETRRKVEAEGGNNSTYNIQSREGETTTPPAPSGPPNAVQTFQTEHTWFLWKDKQGLVDYLNSLIGLWYFNVYANKVPTNIDWSKPKEEIVDVLFPTSDDPKNIRNATDPLKRNQINKVIDSLSINEKSFIGWAVMADNLPADSMRWNPPLITENDLIPVLYNFLNSKKWSPTPPQNPDELPNDNSDGVSTSVKNGWWFLESTNNSLKSFVGDYLAAIIDYRNFNQYFEDPNDPKEPTDDDKNPIPDPYVTNKFIFSSSDYKPAKEFANELNNESYKFPIILPDINYFVNNWSQFVQKFYDLNNRFDKDNLEAYQKERKELAKEISPDYLYSEQFISPPIILKSFTTLNPLDILFIVLGAIIFMVGIFVSVRYRIPGLLAFLMSGLVFVLGSVLYNVFGFIYSFYSLLALAIGTFLSFISPFFLFKNSSKELTEGSTLSAAILKSIKKYWKMSLDMHVMSILASLAFLFFGLTGNINFGSMLIVSVFLSFILSGIIFYILLLFYVYLVNFESNKWFLSNKLYSLLRNTTTFKTKPLWFYNKVSFFNKPSYISLGVFVLIGLVGVILLATIGPFFSLEFSNSNLLIINNFSQFAISKEQVINVLGINVINGQVHDDQLVLYTLNSINISEAINKLTGIVGIKNSQLLAQSTLVTRLTYDASLKVVYNTLKCIGIAIGLCAIWSCLSLNIVSVVPIALSQLLTCLILVGTFGIIAIPIDLNIIPIISFLFIMSTAFSSSVMSCIKSSWDRSISIHKNDLKLLINNIISKVNANFVHIIGLVMLFALLSMILSSVSLVFSLLALLLGMIWLLFFNNRIVILTWYGFILLRDMFNKELLKSKQSITSSRKDYDDVNEQKIVGINCRG